MCKAERDELCFCTSLGINKDGFLLSEHGNILIDIHIQSYIDPKELYSLLKSMTGVIEVSLFVREVTGILLASEYFGWN